MAFKLDKQDTKRREDLVATLREKGGKVEDAVSIFNAAVAELYAPLEAAIADYNETVEEARGFVEDIASTASDEIDEKSEKWLEGDKGFEATEWKDRWEHAELEDMEFTRPDDLSVEESIDHADTLDGLPGEAG